MDCKEYKDILPNACNMIASLENLEELCPIKKIENIMSFLPSKDMNAFFDILALSIDSSSLNTDLQLYLFWDALLQRAFSMELDQIRTIPLRAADRASSKEMIELTTKLVEYKKALFQTTGVVAAGSLSSDMSNRYLNKLSDYAYQLQSHALFPVFLFAGLASPKFVSNCYSGFKYSLDDPTHYLCEAIEALEKKVFFQRNFKTREIEECLQNLHLLVICLCQKTSPALLEMFKRKALLDNALLKELDAVHPGLRRKLINQRFNNDVDKDSSSKKPEQNVCFCVLHENAALNLYAMNQTSHLIDWVFASNYGCVSFLDLEECLFTKTIFSFWEQENEILVDALSAIFKSIKKQLAAIDDETVRRTLDYWKANSRFQEQTESLVLELAMFHYEAAFPSEGRKTAKKAFFEEMVRRYNQ